jgi:hypothetical protein
MKKLHSYYYHTVKAERKVLHTITEAWFAEHLMQSGSTKSVHDMTPPLESVLEVVLNACPVLMRGNRAIASVPEHGALGDYKEPIRTSVLNTCATARRGNTSEHGAFADIMTDLWKGKRASASTITTLCTLGMAETAPTWQRSNSKWTESKSLLSTGKAFIVIDNGQMAVKVSRGSTATRGDRKSKTMAAVTAMIGFPAFADPEGTSTSSNFVDLGVLRNPSCLHTLYLPSSSKGTLVQGR